jgi:hypothetical protein
MGSSLLPSYSDSVFSQGYLYADEDVLLPSKAHQVDNSHIRPAPNHYLPSDLFHYKTPAESNTHRYNCVLLLTSQNSVLGIKNNIPNTVTVLGILSLISKTVLGMLFQVYFIRDNTTIIKLAIKGYSKCHLFLGENI